MDINKLFGSFNKVEKQLLDAVESLNQISKDSVSFGGSIARDVPQNVKNTMAAIVAIINGNENYSLKSLKTNVAQVPLGDLQQQSLLSTQINNDSLNSMGITPVDNTIDVTPDTSGGAQSSIRANESTLQGFFDIYKKNVSNERKLKEAEYYADESFEDFEGDSADDYVDRVMSNRLDFDAITQNSDLASELGFDPSAPIEPEIPISSFAEQFMPEEPSLEDVLGPENEFEDYEDGFEPEPEPYSGSWRDMAAALHPEDRGLSEILNDSREPI